MEQLTDDFARNVKEIDTRLGVGRNYDVISRYLMIGGQRAKFWVVDGYGTDAVLEQITAVLLSVDPAAMSGLSGMEQFAQRFVTFCETDVGRDCEEITTSVLLGKTLLLVEGLGGGVLMDAKSYPTRGVKEPESSKVLRGAHDGFVETLMFNTALIRRRVRDPKLIMESHRVGTRSRTDVVICYLEDKADPQQLEDLRKKLKNIDENSLSMSQESVAEAMMKRKWYNPFPRVRYTERPDVATACVMEGDILLLVDNSPAVMLLPTTFFDFLQGINEFYFPPLVGSYLRLVKVFIFFLSLFIMPLWYLLTRNPEEFPKALQFMAVDEETGVPLLVQILLMELLIDLLKLASLNTPDTLSNAFSMLGALILGDFAIKAHWLVPEVLVYMSFTSISSFAQPSYELGYAFKMMRVAMLLLIAALSWWGFALGVGLMFFLLYTTKPIIGRGYLYPLIPFCAKDFAQLFYRRPISRKNT